MAAPPARPGSVKPLEVMQQAYQEVLVHTGKALRAASRDGRTDTTEALAAIQARIPAAIEKYNWALDDIECEIVRTKSFLLRDLNLLRAARKPPPQAPVSEQKSVAPPAPMGMEPSATPTPEGTGGPFKVMSAMSAVVRPLKQEDKPAVPFANMDLTGSPEAKHSPSPKLPNKPKDGKTAARVPGLAANTGRPASAPPKRETKPPPAQVPRPGSAAPQSGFPPSMQNKPTPIMPPTAPQAAMTAPENNLFTDRTFSLAPAPNQPQAPQPPPPAPQAQPPAQMQAPTHPQFQLQQPPPPRHPQVPPPAEMDIVPGFNLEQFAGGSAGAANVANMGGMGPTGGGGSGEDVNMSNDAQIESLFDLGSGEIDSMDVDMGGLDGGGGGNTNFDELFFDAPPEGYNDSFYKM